MKLLSFELAGKPRFGALAGDGVVDLTPKALLDAKARNLKAVVASLEAAAPAAATAPGSV